MYYQTSSPRTEEKGCLARSWHTKKFEYCDEDSNEDGVVPPGTVCALIINGKEVHTLCNDGKWMKDPLQTRKLITCLVVQKTFG